VMDPLSSLDYLPRAKMPNFLTSISPEYDYARISHYCLSSLYIEAIQLQAPDWNLNLRIQWALDSSNGVTGSYCFHCPNDCVFNDLAALCIIKLRFKEFDEGHCPENCVYPDDSSVRQCNEKDGTPPADSQAETCVRKINNTAAKQENYVIQDYEKTRQCHWPLDFSTAFSYACLSLKLWGGDAEFIVFAQPDRSQKLLNEFFAFEDFTTFHGSDDFLSQRSLISLIHSVSSPCVSLLDRCVINVCSFQDSSLNHFIYNFLSVLYAYLSRRRDPCRPSLRFSFAPEPAWKLGYLMFICSQYRLLAAGPLLLPPNVVYCKTDPCELSLWPLRILVSFTCIGFPA
jgi:hypothetical protein